MAQNSPVFTWELVIRSSVIAAVATVIALAWDFPTRRKAVFKLVSFVLIVFLATILGEILAGLVEEGITRAFPKVSVD